MVCDYARRQLCTGYDTAQNMTFVGSVRPGVILSTTKKKDEKGKKRGVGRWGGIESVA